ncbi:tail tube protein [Nitrosomonas nitrosa]|uniref:phage tail tube protein n=1 Tax=Nitrosomonas nitrosa TaxID=52442 RepID=UPI000D300172|nr:phage tail tube protein [Nitrosomonas nitrosa]PTR04967.1 tail tube protein [Nitrosomonas nitrosa]
MAFLMLRVAAKIGSELSNTAPITGITKGNTNTVIECTNNFTTDDIIVLDSTIVGSPQARNVIAKVKSRTAANVTVEIDSSKWDDWVSSGNVSRVATWIPMTTATNLQFAEPTPQEQQILTIHDEQQTTLFGVDAAPVVSMSVYTDPFDPATVEIRKAAKTRTLRPVAFEFPNDTAMLVNGYIVGGRGVSGGANEVATGEVRISLQSPEFWYEL